MLVSERDAADVGITARLMEAGAIGAAKGPGVVRALAVGHAGAVGHVHGQSSPSAS